MPANYNITFTFRWNTSGSDAGLVDLVRDETSKVAARLTDDRGGSLYDLLKVHDNHVQQVKDLCLDAVSAIFARLSDITSHVDSSSTAVTARMYAPDFDTVDKTWLLRNEMVRFIVARSTASWLEERYPAAAQPYASIAAESFEKIVQIAKTRTAPTRQ